MAKVQWHALQQRLERDTNLRERYEETIKKALDKTASQLQTPVADTLSGTFPITQWSTNRNQTKSAESQMLLPNIRVPHSIMHCWQGWIYPTTCMAFYSASDSTQWQSQMTSRQCSCRLALTARPGLSPFSVDTKWQSKDLKIQPTHFWDHMLTFLCNFCSPEVCKWPQTGTSRGLHKNHAAVLHGWFHADLPFWRGGTQKCRWDQNCFAYRRIQSDKVPEQQTSRIR